MQENNEDQHSLEQTTNQTFRERYRNNSVYKFAVDTAAMVSISIAVMTPIEYFALGMEPEEVVASRTVATIVNASTGRIYGKYRDRIFQKMHTTADSSGVKKYLTDVVTAETFGLPVYAGILAAAGADTYQIITGLAISTLLLTFLGRTTGWWMDVLRKYCGTPTSYELVNGVDK